MNLHIDYILTIVPITLRGGQNSSPQYMTHRRTYSNQLWRTCSAKTKDKALPIEESNDTNIEEATDELLRIQEENEEDDNATKDEWSTTGKTESLSVP